jgi:hypothetical protein
MTWKFGMELSVWLLRKCGRDKIKMDLFVVPRNTAIWFNLDETVHEVHSIVDGSFFLDFLGPIKGLGFCVVLGFFN